MISVIVPIYNKEKEIIRCVNSILEQTYTKYEIILVDDGSKDNSLKICNELAQKYSMIKVIHQENQGVSVARNSGLEEAKGEWIAFIDPDDYIEKEYLEILCKEIQNREDENVDIVSCCCKVEFPNGSRTTNYFFDKDYMMVTFEEKKKIILQILDSTIGQPCKTYTAIGVPWGKLYRKEMICKNNLQFLPELKRAQDNIFNLYAMEVARKIKYINKPMYVYQADHILNYAKKYRSDYHIVYGNWVKERYEFFEHNNWLEDLQIKQVYMQTAIRNTCNIITEKFLNSKYEVSFNRRIEEIMEFCTNYYIPCDDGIIPMQYIKNKKIRLFVWLFNHRYYRILYLIANYTKR